MVKLRRLRIQRFRQVRPGTTLEFADGFNLVLGKNGTGKTTLLELLGACWALDFSAYKEVEFHVELEFSSELGTLSLELQNRRMTGVGSIRWSWTGHLVIRTLINGREHVGERRLPAGVVRGDRLVELLAFSPFSPMMPHEPGVSDLRDSLWETVQWSPEAPMRDQVVQSISAPVSALPVAKFRFDEGLAWLGWGMKELGFFVGDAHSGLLSPSRVGSLGGTLNEDFSRKISPNEVALPDSLTITSQDSLLLGTIARCLDMQGVELTLKRSHQDDLDVFARLEIGMRRADGAKFDSNDMSFGQQRMFAFLWYLACSPEVCIADELANGLHHDWIEAAMQAIGERQSFLATQHPFLIEFLPGVDTAAELQRQFVLCASVLTEGREEWVWRQMSDEEAKEVFEDHKVGFMRLQEVLMSRGLW